MCYSILIKGDLRHLSEKYGAIAVPNMDAYIHSSDVDPKRFPPLRDRIYPGYYAPVIDERNDRSRVVDLMRYGSYPPPEMSLPKNYTTFNARRDNLSSPFWGNAFMKHHGFIVLEGFYEWVAVSDLIKARVVTLDQVEEVFSQQSKERKLKILSAGKKYKPTPTELKKPLSRQIIIEFKPEDGQELMAPVIFSYGLLKDEKEDAGFAVVTDDPPLEVNEAGHDRCPVILEPEAIEEWLHPNGKTPRQMIELLGHKKQVTFRHQLADLVK